MAVELGGVHALDAGEARLIAALVDDARGVFEDVISLWQVVYEEVARGVSGRLVIGEAVLETVLMMLPARSAMGAAQPN